MKMFFLNQFSRKNIKGIKPKIYTYEVSDQTRRQVAAKHRQVLPPPNRITAGHANIQKSFNEKFESGFQDIPVSDLDGGDYQRPPEVYLNAPVYRGDHGPELDQAYTKPLYVPNQRLVHLDLKGAPPKIAYLITFLKKIKDWGATGI